jgi:hypothetical protein
MNLKAEAIVPNECELTITVDLNTDGIDFIDGDLERSIKAFENVLKTAASNLTMLFASPECASLVVNSIEDLNQRMFTLSVTTVKECIAKGEPVPEELLSKLGLKK